MHKAKISQNNEDSRTQKDIVQLLVLKTKTLMHSGVARIFFNTSKQYCGQISLCTVFTYRVVSLNV